MEAQSRKRKAFKNIVVAFCSNILIYVLSLFTSKVIKENLGLEILGLNGVLSNVVSILGLAEMGIASAISFALYKPLAENDISLIKSIMNFYKKAYRVVALVVFVLGLLLLPLIPTFIKDLQFSKAYIITIYLLFLLNSVFSYLLIYKRTLIIADQKNYLVTTVSLVYTYVLKIAQVAIVLLTSNYILMLIVQIVCTVLNNVVVSLICNKHYPYIKEKAEKLPAELYNTIITKVKALFFHSIGCTIVFGTDNLLISYFCGITEAGRYTIYLSIITMIGTIISLIFDNMYDSIGNFLATETVENKRVLFKRLFYLNHTLVSIGSICLAVLLSPFINVWMGDDSLLSSFVVFAMVGSFYFTKNRATIGNFKSSAGLFEKDKFCPILEAILNIIFSVILAKFFGLLGIILGTILSTLCIPFITQPLIVCKDVLKISPFKYFKSYFFYFLNILLIFGLTYFVVNKVICFVPNNLFAFFVEAVVLFISVVALWCLTTFWKSEFKYFYNLIVMRIKRK